MKRLLTTAVLATAAWAAQAQVLVANQPPTQVNVSVRIIEFQSSKDVDTGLSAYLRERTKFDIYGNVVADAGISIADLTFPTPTQAGISVFLDRLKWNDTDFEIVLQALVDENRAFILSRPKVMVPVGQQSTIIKTVRRTPYQKITVVGQTTITVTDFRDTGVTLNVTVPEVIDDDGDWSTNDDTYLNLNVLAEVLEEGQRISVALDQTGAGGPIQNAILVPEFISRSIKTQVWVRNGQVLVLGGLFRNTKDKNLSTVPWLLQTEDLAAGIADRVLPFAVPNSPVSSTVGSRSTAESRRELVFLIKGEIWYGKVGVDATHDFKELEDKKRTSPAEVISDIVEGISEIPEGLRKQGPSREGVGSNLGGRD